MGKIIPFSNLRVLSYRTRNVHKARTCKQLSETHDFDARMDVNFGRLQYPPVVIHFMNILTLYTLHENRQAVSGDRKYLHWPGEGKYLHWPGTSSTCVLINITLSFTKPPFPCKRDSGRNRGHPLAMFMSVVGRLNDELLGSVRNESLTGAPPLWSKTVKMTLLEKGHVKIAS